MKKAIQYITLFKNIDQNSLKVCIRSFLYQSKQDPNPNVELSSWDMNKTLNP
jgi:hypothetical protein